MVASIVLISTMTVSISIWESHPMISTVYYHYNLQYRAGLNSSYEEIVENSLQWIVWMYGNHTNWHYTIECQFMLLEYLYHHDNGKYRHIFNEIQRQNQRGQLELIVPQYSHSYQVPYGIKEFKEQLNYTKQLFKEYNLTQSPLILLQEGQWLPGFAHAAKEFGFKAMIVSKEMLGYFG